MNSKSKLSLNIKNFKSLEDVTVDLKPFTFLFGPNGSGKSSFLNAILFLMKNQMKFNLKGSRLPIRYDISEGINLGTYKEVVTNNDEGRDIKFTFKGSLEGVDIRNLINKDLENGILPPVPFDEIESFNKNILSKRESLDLEEFIKFLEYGGGYCDSFISSKIDNLNFEYRLTFENDQDNYCLKNIEIIENNDEIHFKFLAEKLEIGERDIASRVEEYVNQIYNFENSILKNCSLRIGSIDCDFKFTQHPLSKPSLKSVIDSIIENIQRDEYPFNTVERESEISKINMKEDFIFILISFYKMFLLIPKFINTIANPLYFEGIRRTPKPIYVSEDGTINEFYKNIFNTERISWYLNNHIDVEVFPDRFYADHLIEGISFIHPIIPNFARDPNNHLIREWINVFYILKVLNLAKGIFLSKDGSTYKIMVINNNGSESNLSLASSGLKQLLPIFLSVFIKPTNNGEFIVIEQPEIHIHPKLQSQLTDIFLEIWKKNGHRFLIETHSEHLIRKMQVLVAKGDVSPDDIGVYYFDNKDGKTTITDLRLNTEGNFEKEWPDGFFDDASNLVWELLRVQISRKN